MRKNNQPTAPAVMRSAKMFTDEELAKFEKDLEPFKVTRTITNGKSVTFYDYKKFHQFHGSLNEEGAIIMQHDGFDYVTPTLYEKIENKIRQFSNYIMRREFSKRKKLDELEEMAKSV